MSEENRVKPEYRKYIGRWSEFCKLPHEGFIPFSLEGEEDCLYSVNPYGEVRETYTKYPLSLYSSPSTDLYMLTVNSSTYTRMLSRLIAQAFCDFDVETEIPTLTNICRDAPCPENICFRYKSSIFTGKPKETSTNLEFPLVIEEFKKYRGQWNKAPFAKDGLPVPFCPSLRVTPFGKVFSDNPEIDPKHFDPLMLMSHTYFDLKGVDLTNANFCLRWSDMDVNVDTIAIKLSVRFLMNRNRKRKDLKNPKSKRTLERTVKTDYKNLPKDQPVRWW